MIDLEPRCPADASLQLLEDLGGAGSAYCAAVCRGALSPRSTAWMCRIRGGERPLVGGGALGHRVGPWAAAR